MRYSFNLFTIDLDALTLEREGESLDVQPQVFDVIGYLVTNRDRVVTKEEMLDEIWGDRFVSESALTSRIKSARKLLGDDGTRQSVIKTVHGRGYRWVADVADEGASTPDGPRSPSLPSSTSEFIGRRTELDRVVSLLGPPGSRLVTVLGPGGMGKSRLALEVANELRERYAGRTVWVPLDALDRSSEVPNQIARSMGMSLDAGSDAWAQVRSQLADAPWLLVLDNLEHLSSFEFVSELLESSSDLQILATSREKLQLVGEAVFELGGMTCSSDEALALFEAAAARARSGPNPAAGFDEEVRGICERVGGMPLAIELAAGWSDVLSIPEIAEEVGRDIDFLSSDLQSLPTRQKSIRAVFETSWGRLDHEHQAMLGRLSVFRGGFTRHAAEAVCGARLVDLRALVSKSFLSLGEGGRFSIHELLREFAYEQLTTSGNDDKAAQSHSSYYLGQIADQVIPSEPGGWQRFATLSAPDLDNIRVAWNWAIDTRDTEGIERAVRSFAFWAHLADGERKIGALVAPAVQLIDSNGEEERQIGAVGAQLLAIAEGQIQVMSGDLGAGEASISQAVAELERGGQESVDPAVLGMLRLLLGWAQFLLANNREAALQATRSLEIFEETGIAFGVARCRLLLANNAIALGDFEDGSTQLQECLEIADMLLDDRTRSMARRTLAILHGWHGEWDEANRLLDEALAISTEAMDTIGSAYALRELGKLGASKGAYEDAVDKLERSISLTDRLGNGWESAATRDDLGNALFRMGQFDSARTNFAACLEAAEASSNRYYMARATGDLGLLALTEGDVETGRDLLCRARAMWEEIGHQPYIAWVDLQRARLGIPDLLAGVLAISERHNLAPFALEALALAARSGLLTEPLGADSLGLVRDHPATPAAVRTELGEEMHYSTDPGNLWTVAAAAATHLDHRS